MASTQPMLSKHSSFKEFGVFTASDWRSQRSSSSTHATPRGQQCSGDSPCGDGNVCAPSCPCPSGAPPPPGSKCGVDIPCFKCKVCTPPAPSPKPAGCVGSGHPCSETTPCCTTSGRCASFLVCQATGTGNNSYACMKMPPPLLPPSLDTSSSIENNSSHGDSSGIGRSRRSSSSSSSSKAPAASTYYINHTMVLRDPAARGDWLAWAVSRGVTEIYIAPHAGDLALISIPGVEGSKKDDATFCAFIDELDQHGIDVSLISSPLTDAHFLNNCSA